MSAAFPEVPERQLFYEQMIALPEGRSVSHVQFPFTCHRWHDCFWLLDNDPARDGMRLGVEIKSNEALVDFVVKVRFNPTTMKKITKEFIKP